MCPACTSTATPSGTGHPVTMKVLSVPSGVMENSRPSPLASRTNNFWVDSDIVVFLSLLAAHCDETEQHLVALGFELLDRPSVGFFENALDDLLLKLWCELRIAQPRPPCGHARHQGVHEVLDTALAATEMPQQIGTHHSPAQPGTPRHRIVGVGDVEHTRTDQVN